MAETSCGVKTFAEPRKSVTRISLPRPFILTKGRVGGAFMPPYMARSADVDNSRQRLREFHGTEAARLLLHPEYHRTGTKPLCGPFSWRAARPSILSWLSQETS